MPIERRGTLLLVEDDPGLALGLRDTLAFEGFRVLHADTGETGVPAAQPAKLTVEKNGLFSAIKRIGRPAGA